MGKPNAQLRGLVDLALGGQSTESPVWGSVKELFLQGGTGLSLPGKVSCTGNQARWGKRKQGLKKTRMGRFRVFGVNLILD